MGRTFTTLATGEPEADRANVVELHYRCQSLEAENAELKATNISLKRFIQRLTANQQPATSDKETET